jgi:hypothetical protein
VLTGDVSDGNGRPPSPSRGPCRVMRVALWPETSAGTHAEEVATFLSENLTGWLAGRHAVAVFVAVRPAGGLCGFVEATVRPMIDGCTTHLVGYVGLLAWGPDRNGVAAFRVRSCVTGAGAFSTAGPGCPPAGLRSEAGPVAQHRRDCRLSDASNFTFAPRCEGLTPICTGRYIPAAPARNRWRWDASPPASGFRGLHVGEASCAVGSGRDGAAPGGVLEGKIIATVPSGGYAQILKSLPRPQGAFI